MILEGLERISDACQRSSANNCYITALGEAASIDPKFVQMLHRFADDDDHSNIVPLIIKWTARTAAKYSYVP